MANKDKIHSTTQDFTDIVDIIDEIVILKGKNACCVLEVSSINFFLLSTDEQNARIYGYMALINSLAFAVQILIISKRVDVGTYLQAVDEKIQKVQNPQLKNHLTIYRQFIDELVRSGGILDKKLYIVIPYSYLEASLGAPTNKNVASEKASLPSDSEFATQARNALLAKRAVIQTQVERMGLTMKTLSHEELIKTYYEIFNNDTITVDFNSDDIKNVMV